MKSFGVLDVQEIQPVWFYHSGTTWTNRDDVTVDVRTDNSHETFRSLVVDGELHLVLNMEPFTNGDVGYECFVPQTGVTYRVFVDSDHDGHGQIISRYDRNGVTVLGFLDCD